MEQDDLQKIRALARDVDALVCQLSLPSTFGPDTPCAGQPVTKETVQGLYESLLPYYQAKYASMYRHCMEIVEVQSRNTKIIVDARERVFAKMCESTGLSLDELLPERAVTAPASMPQPKRKLKRRR